MSFLYLTGLLISSACMLLIDHRFKLFFFRDPFAASVVTLIGLVFFLLWDAAGIVMGIFLMGESRYVTGIVVAPEMPLEELFFLTFLSACTMIIYTGAAKFLGRRAETSPAGIGGNR